MHVLGQEQILTHQFQVNTLLVNELKIPTFCSLQVNPAIHLNSSTPIVTGSLSLISTGGEQKSIDLLERHRKK